MQAPAFETINDFLGGDYPPLSDGRTQLFILSDVGMGKTSLLMMIRLMHLMAFWPQSHDCLLLKLGEDTWSGSPSTRIRPGPCCCWMPWTKDPLAWGKIESQLVALLDATTRFRRLIISCRTQFFPETGSDAFGRPGRVEVGEYIYPMIFFSLFDEDQIAAYLRKRFLDRWYERLGFQDNPERLRAAEVVDSIPHPRHPAMPGNRIEMPTGLYRAMVDRWLSREERKLRRQLPEPPSKETLWNVCTAVALHMQPVAAGYCGEFRFSHYSIQEFLVVHALETDAARLPPEPLQVTAEMLEFLALLPRMPDLGRLDLTGLQSPIP